MAPIGWMSGRRVEVAGQPVTAPFPSREPSRGSFPMRVLVCVTPDDFGYWEIADKVSLKAAGFHGMLPTIDMVQRTIVRHFTGRADVRKNTWGRPPPGVSDKDWKPPLPLASKD